MFVLFSPLRACEYGSAESGRHRVSRCLEAMLCCVCVGVCGWRGALINKLCPCIHTHYGFAVALFGSFYCVFGLAGGT